MTYQCFADSKISKGGRIMKSLSIQGVDEQLSAVLREQAAAARKSVSQFVLDTLRQHLGLEKPITDEAQQLTGIVGELAGLLKDRDVDESRGAYAAHLEEKYR
jgi:hypothetical protein